MSENIIIKEITNSLTSDDFIFLDDILKKENSDSILANLNKDLLIRYFQILINSKNIFLFFCKFDGKNVGYAIFTRKPSFLIDEFKELKYLILFNLLSNFKFNTLINILLSVLSLDLLFLSKENKKIINENLNLNLLAIKSEFQSKGIGKKFIDEAISYLKINNGCKFITVETNNNRTGNFYKKKLNFCYIGRKIRFYKNLNIFCKDL